MPIASPIGFLDVVNATLRASQVESTSRLTVANTAATKNFSVGDKFHIDKDSVDPVSVTGNVVATGIKISNLTISSAFDLGAVSNVGNTTANTLQFANATTGFTTTANVEIGGNITLTSNAQVKVGSNVLTEYAGPHPREPKEMPIKKYPEIVFDASKLDRNDTTNTYTQAGYTVSSSSTFISGASDARVAWKAFNGKSINEGSPPNIWQTHYASTFSTSAPYGIHGSNTTKGTFTAGGVTYIGEWIKIKLPHKIKLNYLKWETSIEARRPKKGAILGSNNNTDWYTVKAFNNDLVWAENDVADYALITSSSDSLYTYFMVVIEQVQGGDGSCWGNEISLYGSEEPAPVGDLSLDTNLKSTFNSVRSNNYVMYFDGDEFIPGDNNSNNLVTGSSVSVVHHNATYDSTGKYWTLDGSTESNVTTGDLNLEGDVPHTVSMWVNASNLEANTLSQQLFSIGSGYDKALIRVDDTQITTNTWHNVTYAYQGEGGSKVTYVNGRKVEEEKIENTFGEYPPFSMTNYETGGYRVTTSNDYQSDAANPRPAYNAFSDSGIWMTEFDVYGRNAANNNNGALVTAGAPTIIDTSGTSHLGHYVTLETPFRFRASYLVISSSVDTRRPENVVILGSNDDENWDLVYSNTSVPDDNDNILYFNSTKGYKYHMFLVKNLDPNGEGALYINRLRYFGDKEGDLTRFPEPTRVLKYPNIITKNGNGEAAVNFPTHTGAPYDSYVIRGHVIKASESIASYPAYAAFNGETHVALGTVWVGGYQQYGTGSGASAAGEYGGSRNLKTDLGTGGSATSNGSWLYIEMPHKIKMTSTKIISYDTSPSTGHPPENVIIYGTNDPSSSGGWNVVDNTYATTSSGIPNSQDGKTWAVSTASSPTAYKYFALVIVKTNGVSTYSHAIINDWQLIGTQEDIGTPAIVGGPFAGKVANFRVYDKYLDEERIQEIYDTQKDAFGHKKSSMTLYKGRIGVGTTEPEGALTVLDEPHTMEKFPARDITGNYSIIEEQGCFKISSSVRGGTTSDLDDNNAWQAFNNSGASGHEWASIPPKGTRISEEADFGAWLKIETPESICLKKAEIKSNPHWIQVGPEIAGDATSDQFGVAVACNHDGTRIMAAAPKVNSVAGRVRVYDWDGSAWVQVGQNLTGANETGARFGHALAMSGDGNIIAIGAPFEHSNGGDAGTVRIYYLNGSTWTILPDTGALTGVNAPYVDAFVGPATNDQLGQAVKLSYDGKTLAFNVTNEDEGGTDRGQVRIVKYVNGSWTNKGSAINGTINSQQFGLAMDMSDDGDHIIIGGNDSYPNVRVYKWNASGNSWDLKGSAFTHPSPNDDGFGQAVAISNDGNVVAIGIRNADLSDGAITDNTGIVKMYHWSGSAWTLKDTLIYPHSSPNNDDDFGTTVNLSGDGKRLIVSSPWFDDSGDDNPGTAGKLWVYEYNNKNWILRRPNPRTSAPTSGGYISVSGTDSGGIGLVGNQDSVLGAGIENDRWTNLGLPDMGGQSIAISRDGSAILAGEWAYNSSSAGGDRGRIRVWNMPSNIKSIWGSNDNKNWTKITTAPTREEATSNVAGFQFGYNDFIDIKNIDNSNYYKYHAIVADSFTRLRDVKLFGVRKQGSSTLHDGSLTLTKNLDVPRIGPALDADDTPRRDKLLVEFNTTTNPSKESLDPDAAYKTGSVVRDTSGRGNHGLMVGSVYNIDQKALEFVNSPTATSSAATSYLYRDDLGNQEDGNFHHSISLWFKMKTAPSSVYRTIFEIGPHPRNNTQDIALYVTNDANNWLGFASGGNTLLGGGLASVAQEGRYYHIVIVYDGRKKYLYVDGKLSTSAAYSSFNGVRNMTLQMARNNHANANEGIDGCVSNFKMYINHALTPQEVRTLYGMGQCDEGHHNVNFSKTRVGIGLGDGEVSKALLDVRGSVCLGSPYGGSTVGIGTNLQESYPKDVPLHVYRHAPAASNKGGGIMLERYPGYGGAIWSEYSGTEDCLMFKTGQNTNNTYGADPQMVLTHTGQVGIGTSQPGSTSYAPGTSLHLFNNGGIGASYSGDVLNASSKPRTSLLFQKYTAAPGAAAWGEVQGFISLNWMPYRSTRPHGIGVYSHRDSYNHEDQADMHFFVTNGGNGVDADSLVIEGTGGSQSTVTVNGSGVSSDDRLKTGETVIRDALKSIKKLTPQIYAKHPFYGSFSELKQNVKCESGLIVQDVWYDAPEFRHLILKDKGAWPSSEKPNEPVPGDITVDPDYSDWGARPASLNYIGLIPYIISSIKELCEEIPHRKISTPTELFSNIEECHGLIVSKRGNISLSSKANDKAVYGVVSETQPMYTENNEIYVKSHGEEGHVWIINTSNLEAGDYITTSNVHGYGQKQDSEFLANYTVAKITTDCDFTQPVVPVKKVIQQIQDVKYWVYKHCVGISKELYDTLPDRDKCIKTEDIYKLDGVQIDPTPNPEDVPPGAELETITQYCKIDRIEFKKEIPGLEVEVRQELVNVLDEHGQIQWEDDPTETEKAYKIRYLDADGNITDEANAVHIAAFVGCTYHCG